MQILLCTREIITGGGEVFLRDLANELKSLGYQVRIRCHSNAGINNLAPNIDKIGFYKFSGVSRVIANDFRSLWMSFFLSPTAKRAFVVHGRWQISRIRVLICYISFTKVICVSEALSNHAKKLSYINKNFPTINLAPVRSIRYSTKKAFQFFDLKGVEFRVGNIARLDPIKNLLLYSNFIDSLLTQGHSIDASLLTFKPQNTQEKQILDSLSSNIKIYHEDKPHDYLQNIDVLVSTSMYESFGYSLVESLMSGVPVFTTAEEGPREFLIGELAKGYSPGIFNVNDLTNKFLEFRTKVDRLRYIEDAERLLTLRSVSNMTSQVLRILK
jgi:glycosyltransferase involved in cell wall biosynthesis